MTLDTPVVVAAAVAVVVGFAVAWFAASGRARARAATREALLTSKLAVAEERAASEAARREEVEGELRAVDATRDELDRRLAGLEVELRTSREQVAEQQRFLEDSRKQLEDAFRSLASSALEGSQKQFLELAEQRWKTTREQAASDLEQRRHAIEALLAPLKEGLTKLDRRTGELEKERQGAYEGLREHLTHLHEATRSLNESTTTLASALRGSQVRGRWGELALRNVAELAGMTEHCDFDEQAATADGKRPDMVVRLPEKRFIAVDAKVPLAGYLKSVEATDDAARRAGLKEHVQAVRAHVKALAARDYAEGLQGDVDLVVLFLPGDPFLAAAFAEDPDLQVEALRSKVLLATPTTLVALLRTVAVYYQQRSLAENAEQIAALSRELYDRAAKFGDDLARLGRGLRQAVDAYNAAVGSFDRRLVPMGQKLADLKVTEQSRRELVSPDEVASLPREVQQLGPEETPDPEV